MFSFSNYLTLTIAATIAVCIDAWVGETKRFHPLVGFGYLASCLEGFLNPDHHYKKKSQRFAGILTLCLLVLPITLVSYWICQLNSLYFIANTSLLYFAIGNKSLHEHATAVLNALNKDDIAHAKLLTSYIVSRDIDAIDPIPATIESVLENGNDSVFGAVFWFFIAGGAGAIGYRLVNTLDAMWGYKTKRFLYFGWASARLDDLLNYVPARLTAITYAILGHTKPAIHCWKNQAPLWDSPNAGPVMSAGAGALDIKLGGAARYDGEWHLRPHLGTDNAPTADHILSALTLVRHGLYLWLIIALLLGTSLYYA
jgi:adenosylcobinamide-phosphate synthase